MASMAQQLAADEAAVEAIRRQFGDAEAAKLAADLYKLRRTPAPSTFAGFPRWAVVGIALWLAVLETADKLPQVLLAYPRYEAALADVKTKLMQPDLTVAQLDKARFDAKAAAFQPDLAATQLQKTKLEAKAAAYQPALLAAQSYLAAADATAKNARVDDPESANRISLVFDLLHPDHPDLAARGVIDPTKDPQLKEIVFEQTLKHMTEALAEKKTQDQQATPPQQPRATAPEPAPTPLPAPTPAPAPAPPVETHRPPSKKATRNNDPRKVGAIVAQPIAPESVTQNEFEVGQQDARDWHTWYVQQNGHAHEGAAYAYNAYLHNALTPDVCEENPAYMTRAAFHAACDLAYGRLIVIAGEERRDSQYSSGFNHGVVSK